LHYLSDTQQNVKIVGNNLISAIMAKKMGAALKISRLTNLKYLKPDKQEMFRSLGIDKIISPTQLAV
jgi:Trk K+ transport system NAD-binding subunit